MGVSTNATLFRNATPKYFQVFFPFFIFSLIHNHTSFVYHVTGFARLGDFYFLFFFFFSFEGANILEGPRVRFPVMEILIMFRGVDLLLDLPDVNVGHSGIPAVEYAGDLLERWTLGLHVEKVDKT